MWHLHQCGLSAISQWAPQKIFLELVPHCLMFELLKKYSVRSGSFCDRSNHLRAAMDQNQIICWILWKFPANKCTTYCAQMWWIKVPPALPMDSTHYFYFGLFWCKMYHRLVFAYIFGQIIFLLSMHTRTRCGQITAITIELPSSLISWMLM